MREKQKRGVESGAGERDEREKGASKGWEWGEKECDRGGRERSVRVR